MHTWFLSTILMCTYSYTYKIGTINVKQRYKFIFLEIFQNRLRNLSRVLSFISSNLPSILPVQRGGKRQSPPFPPSPPPPLVSMQSEFDGEIINVESFHAIERSRGFALDRRVPVQSGSSDIN